LFLFPALVLAGVALAIVAFGASLVLALGLRTLLKLGSRHLWSKNRRCTTLGTAATNFLNVLLVFARKHPVFVGNVFYAAIAPIIVWTGYQAPPSPEEWLLTDLFALFGLAVTSLFSWFGVIATLAVWAAGFLGRDDVNNLGEISNDTEASS
jgi:hypothetical protein